MPAAPDPPHPFRHAAWRTFTPADGLASLYVEYAQQDRDGFLWFVTARSGASRFDGEEFVSFTKRDGLCGDALLQVLHDRQGRLWFATHDAGVCWYDGRAFHRHETLPSKEAISCMYEDRDGRLWFVGPRTLCCLDGERLHDWQPAFVAACGSESEFCWGVAQDANGDLWLGAERLVRFDGGAFHVVDDPGLPPASRFAYAVGQDARGRLWVGGSDQVAVRDGDGFRTILDRPLGQVRRIQADPTGRVWAGTTGSGAYTLVDDRVVHVGVADGLTYHAVNHVFGSPDGLLWFCTWGGGVSCCDPHLLRLDDGADEAVVPRAGRPHTAVDGLMVVGGDSRSDSNAWSVCQDRADRVWAATSVGLLCWDGGERRALPREGGLGADVVLVIDGDDVLWLRSGHWDGLLRCDGVSYTETSPWPGDAHIARMAIDGQGKLLVGYNRPEGVGFGRFDGAGLQVLYQQPADHGGGRLIGLAAARDGGCWFSVGTPDGDCRIGKLGTDGAVTWRPGPREEVDVFGRELLEDRHGRLWLLAWPGLLRLEGDRWVDMLAPSLLPAANPYCLCIHEDRQGGIWVGTEHGALHYDGERFQLVSSPHIKGPVRSILQDRDGHLWFATADGVLRYTPTVTRPRVRVLRVDADRTYDGDEALQVPASNGQVLFSYRGIGFRSQPRQMHYAHRLEGLEQGWTVGRQQRAAYPDLAPGDYRFVVKAIDVDLNESEPAIVDLTVVPDPRVEGYVQALSDSGVADEFVGESQALRRAQAQLVEVAGIDVTVLILGETGTGKGLAARALHAMSGRRGGPFLQVNCGALPEALVESELFGHEKGAFTGAISRKLGKVELAARGTLFLDEIGDMPLMAQAKLLRLLEEGTFERVGGTQTLTAEARLVAATNRDLEAMVAEGSFRQDLFYRLQGFPIHLPPLRERRDDIELLTTYFAEGMAAHLRKEMRAVDAEAIATLRARDWPGNVRELAHVVQRAVIVCRSPVLGLGDLGLAPATEAGGPVDDMITPEAYERRYLEALLARTDGVIKGPQGAAALLGVAPSTLRSRLKKLGIQRP